MWRLSCAIGLVFCQLFSCKTTERMASTKKFVKPGEISTVDITGTITLSRADRLGIPYKVLRKDLAYTTPDYGITYPYTDISFVFEELSQPACEELKNAYAIGQPGSPYHFKSKIPCIAGLTYYLEDFLPPIVGALKGLTFESESQQRPNMGTMNLDSNCWNFAYEFARFSDTEFDIYFLPMEIDGSLRRQSEKIGAADYKVESDRLNVLNTFNMAQPGDLVLVYGQFKNVASDQEKGLLYHATVVVDKGVFFEKSMPGTGYNYLFSTADHILNTYYHMGDRNVDYFYFEIWRPKTPFTPITSHAELERKQVEFGGDQIFATVRLNRDDVTGRYFLNEAAMSSLIATTDAAMIGIPQEIKIRNEHDLSITWRGSGKKARFVCPLTSLRMTVSEVWASVPPIFAESTDPDEFLIDCRQPSESFLDDGLWFLFHRQANGECLKFTVDNLSVFRSLFGTRQQFNSDPSRTYREHCPAGVRYAGRLSADRWLPYR